MILDNSSTSNFRKFLYCYLLPYLTLMLILISILGIFMEKEIILGSSSNGAYKINTIINSIDPHEVPIIGSSRAQGSLIPDSLGDQVFNYGMDGTGMNIHLFILQQELKKHKTTPIILNIDMRGIGYGNGDLSYFLYNSSNSELENATGITFPLVRKIPFIKYYGFFENYFAAYLTEKINFTKVSNKGGSFEINQRDSLNFQKNIRERLENPEKFEEDEKLTHQFETLLKENGARKIYLVISPYHKTYLQSYIGLQDFNKFLEKFKQFPNISVLDFSNLDLPDSCFFNTSHLNYIGAKRFSHLLKQRINLN